MGLSPCCRSLPEIAHEALNDLRHESQANEKNLVFPSKNGTYFYAHTILDYFQRDLEKAGIVPEGTKPKPFHFHNLRHTCASLQLASGTDIKTVQEMLGHSDARMTQNTYTHSPAKAQEEAAKRINDFMKKVPQ